MSERRVGIVLVNYNGMKFMPECLASLAKLDYGAHRIVVVDNASTDGSADWLAEHYPDVVLLRQETNTGITGGNNAGISWCLEQDCEYVLLLNNDTVVEPDFLRRLIQHAAPNMLISPKIYYHDNPTLLNNHFGHFDYWRGVHRNLFYGKPDTEISRTVCVGTMASTCALLIPASLFAQVGMMDDAYFIYADDTDFITRAVRQGAVVKFVPDAVIYHKESSSSGGKSSPLAVYYLVRNRLYFMFKHQRNRFILAFFLCYFTLGRLAYAALLLRRGDRGLIRVMANAIADFMHGRMGKAPVDRFSVMR